MRRQPHEQFELFPEMKNNLEISAMVEIWPEVEFEGIENQDLSIELEPYFCDSVYLWEETE